MFNLASKLLAAVFDPLTIVIVLAVAGLLFWKRRRLALLLLLASTVILLLCSSPIVSDVLVHSLEDQYPDRDNNLPAADAIVVLGGALHSPSPWHHASELTEGSDRLLEAYRLYKAGKAPLIFCSGGHNPLGDQASRPPEAVWMAHLLEEWGVPSAAIQLESSSIDTHQNAIWTHRFLAARGVRTILLVTSAIHMPRAAGAFRKAGFDVIPAPADYRTGWESLTATKWLPSAGNLANCDTALHEWVGIVVYRVRGWI